jgi:hypothetical protein
VTDRDAYEDEVSALQQVSDAEIEQVLRGEVDSAPTDMHDVAALLGDVRTRFGEAPPPLVEHAHVSAITEAAAAEPRRLAPSPKPSRPARRLRYKIAAAAAYSAAALLALGGLAAANRLPAPVQRAVSDAAAKLGIDLPDGESTDEARGGATPGPDGSSATQGHERRDSGEPKSSSRAEGKSGTGSRNSSHPDDGSTASGGKEQGEEHHPAQGPDDEAEPGAGPGEGSPPEKAQDEARGRRGRESHEPPGRARSKGRSNRHQATNGWKLKPNMKEPNKPEVGGTRAGRLPFAE